MFLAVGTANGVGMLYYHYSLIKGMLTNTTFLLFVFGIWTLYALKCAQFILITSRKPQFAWLYMLSLVKPAKVYGWFFQVQLILFLPVLWYCCIILGVGYYEHWYLFANLSLIFIVAICAAFAAWYTWLLQNPDAKTFRTIYKWPFKQNQYVGFLIRFIVHDCKALFFVIKIYNCATLFLMLENRNPAHEQDIRMIVMFYCFGMLGHGLLIHRLKEMENSRMAFYRGMPVSSGKRFAQYAWFYLLIFIPEMITIATRVPAFLYFSEAVFFIFFGYGILLLLNSFQLYSYKGLKDYLVVIVQIFFAVIIAMVSWQLYVLSFIFFILSMVVFFRRYYLFEPQVRNVL
jgi:hypothetical protein